MTIRRVKKILILPVFLSGITALFIVLLSSQAPAAQPGKGSLGGFAETPWKSTYDEVFNRMKALATSRAATEQVEILKADRNKSILIKRNDILYRYNFYRTPLKVVRLTDHNLTEEEYDRRPAQLFHVKVTPSFLDSSLVKKKLEDNYGPRTRSTVDDTLFGADIWVLNGGFIFQWYEPYRGTSYTRTIDYLSSELASRIMKEYEDYFDAPEKKLLQEIIVR